MTHTTGLDYLRHKTVRYLPTGMNGRIPNGTRTFRIRTNTKRCMTSSDRLSMYVRYVISKIPKTEEKEKPPLHQRLLSATSSTSYTTQNDIVADAILRYPSFLFCITPCTSPLLPSSAGCSWPSWSAGRLHPPPPFAVTPSKSNCTPLLPLRPSL